MDWFGELSRISDIDPNLFGIPLERLRTEILDTFFVSVFFVSIFPIVIFYFHLTKSDKERVMLPRILFLKRVKLFIKRVKLLGLYLILPLNCVYILEQRFYVADKTFLLFISLLCTYRIFFYLITKITLSVTNKTEVIMEQYNAIDFLLFPNLLLFVGFLITKIFHVDILFKVVILLALFLLAIMLLIDLWKLFRNSVAQNISYVLTILYFCTLKVLPILYFLDILRFLYEHQ